MTPEEEREVKSAVSTIIKGLQEENARLRADLQQAAEEIERLKNHADCYAARTEVAEEDLKKAEEEIKRLRTRVVVLEGLPAEKVRVVLAAHIEAALALHYKKISMLEEETCGYCLEEWPCQTRKALRGE